MRLILDEFFYKIQIRRIVFYVNWRVLLMGYRIGCFFLWRWSRCLRWLSRVSCLPMKT